MGPQLLALAVGLLGPFRPPLPCCTLWGAPPCTAAVARVAPPSGQKNFFFGSPLKKNKIKKKLPVPVPVAGAGDADPKNKKYIAIPFICHLRERSVTTQS